MKQDTKKRDTDLILADIQEIVKDLFTVKSAQRINHTPDVFCLGPSHVSFASDRYAGIIGEDCVNDKNFPVCCNCKQPYSKHKSNYVLLLSLKRDVTNKEANELLPLTKTLLEEGKFEGIAFVDTPEKYRFI